MADWSELPPEILHLISQHLHASIYIIRFRSVCRTWRAAAPPAPPATAHFPFTTKTSERYNLLKYKVYLLQSSLPGKSSWIVKFGWARSGRMRLLHAIDGSQLKFPGGVFDFSNIRVRELGEEYRLLHPSYQRKAASTEHWHPRKEKVAVLNNGRGGFVILAIHISEKLMVYKSVDNEWSFIVDDSPWRYDDIILWGGRFYAVDKRGRVVLVNTEDLNVLVVTDVIKGGFRSVLVGSDTELLLVNIGWDGKKVFAGSDIEEETMNRYLNGLFDMFNLKMRFLNLKMRVFRLGRNTTKWRELSDLQDRIVLLGRNCPFLASSLEIFDDDKCGGIYCNGFFDLEDGYRGENDSFIRCSNLFCPPFDWVFSLHQ